MIKNRAVVMAQFREQLKIGSGLERLINIAIFFVFFVHIGGCFFVLLTVYEDDFRVTWLRPEFESFTQNEKYITSIYFVVTTICTVGYGDVSVETPYEQVFCIILMCIGVTGFTFISGALSSILSNYDQSNASL
jgi:lysylphosphatidylglycerol synthetase-like protein (DUF2156 family)